MGFLKHIDTILNSAELACDDGSPLIRNIFWSVTVLIPVVMTHHCKVVSSQIRSQLTTHEFVAVAGDESGLSCKLLIDHSQFSDIVKKEGNFHFHLYHCHYQGCVCLFCFQPLRCQWCGGFPTERCLHVWLVSSLSVWWLAGTIVDSAVVSFVTNAPSFSRTLLPVSFLLKCLERESFFASSTLTICNMKGGKASSCVKFKKQNLEIFRTRFISHMPVCDICKVTGKPVPEFMAGLGFPQRSWSTQLLLLRGRGSWSAATATPASTLLSALRGSSTCGCVKSAVSCWSGETAWQSYETPSLPLYFSMRWDCITKQLNSKPLIVLFYGVRMHNKTAKHQAPHCTSLWGEIA